MRLFGRPNNRIAAIKIEGVISDSDLLGTSRARIIEALKEAERKKVRAIVVRINSPGGTVAACQEVFCSISRLRQRGLPVVASMGDVAASGGVYISMAANQIVASPGSVTGSIGVIIRSSDLSDFYHKIGVSPKVVKSGPHKDMLATYRSFSEEERKLLQDLINDTHDQFIEAVAAARNRPKSEIEVIADGRILTGRQAFQLGLVDVLGDMETAVELAASLAGIKKPKLISVRLRRRWRPRLFAPIREGIPHGIPLWVMPSL
jgi:protease-4